MVGRSELAAALSEAKACREEAEAKTRTVQGLEEQLVILKELLLQKDDSMSRMLSKSDFSNLISCFVTLVEESHLYLTSLKSELKSFLSNVNSKLDVIMSFIECPLQQGVENQVDFKLRKKKLGAAVESPVENLPMTQNLDDACSTEENFEFISSASAQHSGNHVELKLRKKKLGAAVESPAEYLPMTQNLDDACSIEENFEFKSSASAQDSVI